MCVRWVGGGGTFAFWNNASDLRMENKLETENKLQGELFEKIQVKIDGVL